MPIIAGARGFFLFVLRNNAPIESLVFRFMFVSSCYVFRGDELCASVVVFITVRFSKKRGNPKSILNESASMQSDNSNIRKSLSEFHRYKDSWCLTCNYSGLHGVRREIYPWFLTWRTPLVVFLFPWIVLPNNRDLLGLVVFGSLLWALAAYGAVVLFRWIVAWKSYEIVCPNCGREHITTNKPFNYLDYLD